MTTVVVIGIFTVLALLTAGLLFFEALREKNHELKWLEKQVEREWGQPAGSYRVMDCRSYEVDE